MERESKILLTTGFLLLFGTLGWSVEREGGGALPASAAFLTRDVPAAPELPLVGIVFSPQDCGAQIEQLRLWNGPYLEHQARVSGLLQIAGKDPTPLWKVVHGAGLRFSVRPVRPDAAARLQRSLGYPDESFLAVFDPSGRLRLAVPLAQLSEPRERAVVLRLVRGLRREVASARLP
jgi:hypothetical protein